MGRRGQGVVVAFVTLSDSTRRTRAIRHTLTLASIIPELLEDLDHGRTNR